MKKNLTLIIIGGIVVIVVLWFISAQNSLVSKQEEVNSSWDQVENVYQRRMDLIPNLVETVKGYAEQEREVLTTVTEMRSRAGQIRVDEKAMNNPEAVQRFVNAQSELSGALTRLLAVKESYPELKSNENFKTLQHQLEGAENRISTERRRFIKAVQEYNTAIRRFPTSLVASIGGFERMESFSAEEGAEQAPQVEF